MAQLQILSGKRQGTVIELPEAVDVDIGNRKSAKLTIRDPWISYNHAKIRGQSGRFYIEDMGSSNGTWINGEKVKRQELAANVLIYLGKTKVKFTLEGEAKVAADELGAKPGETPWWDKVIDDGAGKKAGSVRVRRLESELREERRMRQALEKFLQLPKGASVGDAARAGELEQKIRQLESSSSGDTANQTAIDEAVDAERSRTEKLRREHMSKIVELEGKVAHADSKVVELEGRLKDKAEQVKKEVAKAKEKSQAEIDELKAAVEEARKSASTIASGGDEALGAHAEKLGRELDEWKEKARTLEDRAETLESELKEAKEAKPSGDASEKLETLKSQLWASVEEATKWKEEASQLTEEVEALRGDADKWKEDHAQVLQEIDDISMEQIEVEEELNARIDELEGILDEKGIDYPKIEDDNGEPEGDAGD